jgi:hypothetical protein
MPSHTKGSRSGHSKDSKSKRSSNKRHEDDAQEQCCNIYCAVYTPEFGNYYHWALAVYKIATREWHIFQVVQETEGAAFSANHRRANPTDSRRCRQPLTYLGRMHIGWWSTLREKIRMIQVPGEAVSWNCQDYVMDIWSVMKYFEMITDETWQTGKESMMPYYGQDYGGEDEDEEEDEEAYEDNDGEEDRILSAEYIDDSDE